MFKGVKKGFSYGAVYPTTAYFESVGLAGKKHIGIDYLTPIGTPVYAPGGGKVTYRKSSAVGNACHFMDEFGRLTRFLHLREVQETRTVQKGEIIAYTGNTGISTGPHCHVDTWIGASYTGNFKDTLDPEKYWDDPIRVKILYTVEGNIHRLDSIREWYRPYVNLEFTYELVPDRPLRKTGNGKYFNDYDVQMNFIPYADGYDICYLFTPQLDKSTGLYGYHDKDDFFGLRFCVNQLDYSKTRKQNDPDLPRGMIEGVMAHELSHCLANMQGKRFAQNGNKEYSKELAGHDNTHYFDYIENRLVDFVATFDTRRMKRSSQERYMFKHNRGGTTKRKPKEVVNAVYRNWSNTLFAAYTVNGWEKITEQDFKKSKATAAKSYVFSDSAFRWINANTDLQFDFPIIGIRATTRGTAGRYAMLKALGWSEYIPMSHLK